MFADVSHGLHASGAASPFALTCNALLPTAGLAMVFHALYLSNHRVACGAVVRCVPALSLL